MKQGDTAPSYAVVLADDDGWVDLTAAEKVKLLVRSVGAEDPAAPDVSGEMTFSEEEIPDPEDPEGPKINVWVAVYDWQVGDLDMPAGEYSMEQEVTWESGKVETFPADEDLVYLKLILLEDLG